MALAGAPRTTSAVPAVDHAAGGGNLGAELAHAKRREAEATTRVAALEAKLKSTSSVQGEMQASVQELSHRLQVLHHPPCFLKFLFAVFAAAKKFGNRLHAATQLNWSNNVLRVVKFLEL